jgi:hypothetical protein
MPHKETNPEKDFTGLSELRTALGERSASPSGDAWARLSARLDQAQKPKRRVGLTIPLWAWSAAAALVIGLVFWPKSGVTSKIAEPVMEQFIQINPTEQPLPTVSSDLPKFKEATPPAPAKPTIDERGPSSISNNNKKEPLDGQLAWQEGAENAVSPQLELELYRVDAQVLAAEIEAEIMLEQARTKKAAIPVATARVDPYTLWLDTEKSIETPKYLPVIDLLKTGYTSVKTAVALQIK